MKLHAMLLLLLLPGQLLAQAPDSSWFSLSLQPSYLQLTEQLIVGKRHSGPGILLAPAWQKITANGTHQLKLSLAYANPKTDLEEAATSTWLNLALAYTYSRPVAELASTPLRVGSLLKADYRMAYYPNWDDSHMYWANFLGGGLAASISREFKAHHAYYANLQLPLIGWVSRPKPQRDYKIEDTSVGNILKLNHQHMEMATIGGYFNPGAEVGLQLKFSGKFSMAYCYQFSYLSLRASYSQPYQELQQSLGIKFIF